MKTINDMLKIAINIGFPEETALDGIIAALEQRNISVPKNYDIPVIDQDTFQEICDSMSSAWDSYIDILREVIQ